MTTGEPQEQMTFWWPRPVDASAAPPIGQQIQAALDESGLFSSGAPHVPVGAEQLRTALMEIAAAADTPASGRPATVGGLVNEHDWFLVGDGGGPDIPVFVRLGRDHASGRLVCTGLLVGDLNPFLFPYRKRPREINAAVLRGIRLPQLIGIAVRQADLPDDWGAAVRELLADAPLAGRTVRPGAAGYDDEHFVKVAKAYRAALIEAPHAPTKLLAQRLHVSLPTARRWIQRARDRGYLGAATPGRAGEHPTTAQSGGEADR